MAAVKQEKIDKFRPQRRNLNKHKQRGMGTLEMSMRKLGYVAPMTAAADGEIIDGSARLETSAIVFDDDVLVVHHDGTKPIIMVRDDIASADSPEAREISIAANRIAELNLDWDVEQLLADAQSGLDMTGLFEQSELDAMLAELIKPTSAADRGSDDGHQIERMAELKEKYGTEPGQIWTVGKHRIMCGDSGNAEDVSKLLDGATCDGIVTDPPYDLEPKFVSDALALFSNRAVLLCGGKLAFRIVNDDWKFHLDLVWKHRQPRSFATPYQPVMYHNNIVMLTRNNVSLGWERPDKGFGSIIEVGADVVEYVDRDYGHGKCVEIFEELLRGFKWQRCAEPFLGTGATVLACERRRVTCYGMEKDPGIMAVALERLSTAGLKCTQLC